VARAQIGRTFMRIIVIALASALAVCFIDPASAATRRATQYTNPDRGPYPASRGCEGATCFRSGHQKMQHPRHK
jgi:hypothetical protein